MRSVLAIDQLTRSYGQVIANDRVSLTVEHGEVVGLLGHNGAGKSTLVNQVVGLLKPDSGSIMLGHLDAVAHPDVARRHVSIQPQAQAPIDGLSPKLAIELAGRIRGLSSRDAKASAASLIDELDLGEWADRRAGGEGTGLSGGVRRLTSFAMALAAPTPLLILDEPTNDVDAARRKLLWAAVRRRGDEGAGVLVVTHNVTEAERIVDDLVILHHGKVVASGAPGALRGTDDDDLRLEIHLNPGAEDPTESPGIATTRRTRIGRRVLLTIPQTNAAQGVTWAAELRSQERIESYSLTPTTLEDAYLALTSDAAEQEHGNV